jgi:hypothetical protein
MGSTLIAVLVKNVGKVPGEEDSDTNASESCLSGLLLFCTLTLSVPRFEDTILLATFEEVEEKSFLLSLITVSLSCGT